MIKLLAIADDFTGALDTGVKFHNKNTIIRVGKDGINGLDSIKDTVDVLVIDTETRHLTPAQAHDVVFEVVKKGIEAGIPCIYKKTDSGLRGNLGAELTAALEASGRKALHFAPAFPVMNRSTVNGVHLIDGVPVAESVFGLDPFEPVRHSKVTEIIAEQSDAAAVAVGSDTSCTQQGILVYDSVTDGDMEAIVKALFEQDELHLVAGCAGLAGAMPSYLGLEQNAQKEPDLSKDLTVVCGSVNPVTVKQLDDGEMKGALRLRMHLEQKLSSKWLGTPEGDAQIAAWKKQLEQPGITILESASNIDSETVPEYAQRVGITMEDVRFGISDVLGKILKQMVDDGLERTFLITGGDTLLSFMNKIDVNEIQPVCEAAPGVVLTHIGYKGKTYDVLTKSGGFGRPELLSDIQAQVHP